MGRIRFHLKTIAWAEQEFRVFAQKVCDIGAGNLGFSVVAIDVTEQNLVIQTLQQSEEHFRHPIELNPDIAWACHGRRRCLLHQPNIPRISRTIRCRTAVIGAGWERCIRRTGRGTINLVGMDPDGKARGRSSLGLPARWNIPPSLEPCSRHLGADSAVLGWYGVISVGA